jgi:diaminopimelate decarboxylase
MTWPAQIAYRGGRLCVEDVELDTLAARFGTPTYVYSLGVIDDAIGRYQRACAGHDAAIHYAVKANSNLAILQQLADTGAGFDIVSGGELARVLAAGGSATRVIFSGVGKTRAEMDAALAAGIACFNVESRSELGQLAELAQRRGVRAPVSLRVNPDVDPKTHPYIATGLAESKFGVPYDDAFALYEEAAAIGALEVAGVGCHIGSQLTDVEPLLAALERLIALVDRLEARGIAIGHLDLGGGLGVRYRDETPPDPGAFVARVLERVELWRATSRGGRPMRVLFEPGRSIVAAAGVLLTRVQVLKPGSARNFAVVDAAMNDLVRPAMYDAWHEVVPTRLGREAEIAPLSWQLVGPICESGDWLAHDRELALAEGDHLAFLNAGAYAMAMASNYNTRARAAEVAVRGDVAYLIREREQVRDLYAGERLIPD